MPAWQARNVRARQQERQVKISLSRAWGKPRCYGAPRAAAGERRYRRGRRADCGRRLQRRYLVSELVFLLMNITVTRATGTSNISTMVMASFESSPSLLSTPDFEDSDSTGS